MYWHNGDMAAGLPLAEKAVESAQKRNAPEVIARSYIILGKNNWLERRLEEGG